jgi:hypothetical protein
MKKISAFLFVILCAFSLKAQLPDGSVAPNFITTDLEGNSYELYKILDQGKSVVIDLSATWCGPCWDFHQSGVMEQLWENYGPNGTDEMVVMTIEGDERTNIDCIYNLPGCNNSTWGNWTTGVEYPFINDDNIADMYELSYWPTVYLICQNRQTTELSTQTSTAQSIYNLSNACAQPSGANNAGIILYESFEGAFCGSVQFSPKVKVQNLGTDNITSLSVDLMVEGSLVETKDWTGTLATFQIADIEFSELDLNEDTNFEIMVTSVNGIADEDVSNNMIARSINTIVSDDNFVTLEFKTDDYPLESYWEMVDGSGNALYTGGNSGIFGDPATVEFGAYTVRQTLFTHELPLPEDGCFSFNMYDFFGDGIQDYGGYYRLRDSAGNIISSGGDFEALDERPFQVEGSTVKIENNAAIVLAQGLDVKFCEAEMLAPSVLVQNLGTNDITDVVLEAYNDTETLSTTTWSGTIAPAQYGNIVLEEFLASQADLNFRIVTINGIEDTYGYKNQMERNLDIPNIKTTTNTVTLELNLDQYAYEAYWQLTDFNDAVVASGGNTNVGPEGGGRRTATGSDPGAYANFHQETIMIDLPEADLECYDFLMVDDWGDGMDPAAGGGGSYRLLDQDGNLLFESVNQAYVTQFYRTEVSRLVSGVQNLDAVDALILYPNPTQGQLHIDFHLQEHMSLKIEVLNILGQAVKQLDQKDFLAGNHEESYKLDGLSNGLYILSITNGTQQMTQRFVNQF